MRPPHPPKPPGSRRRPFSHLLSSDAALLDFTSHRLEHNLAGLQETLRLTRAELLRLVRSDPTALRAAPAAVKERYVMLKETLQVGSWVGAGGTQLRRACTALSALCC
jgi:hypothetical protein